MAEAKVGDILTRLEFYTESDALDFQKTGRLVIVAEDGVAELPLPKGPQGDDGPRGPSGSSLRPDLVLDEETDGEALTKLQERSVTWRTGSVDRDGYFAINKPTGSGFFYSRGGWTVLRDIFGGSSEIVAGEFTFPVFYRNVEAPPATPIGGVVVYSEAGSLKAKKPDGTVVTLA